MLQKSCSLQKLPSGYWNIHKDLRDAITKADLWEFSCLGKLALGDSFERESRLLLVTGEAGCGKTNLLLHIAKLLLKRRSYSHSDPHRVIIHFSDDKNTIQDCLSSLQEQFRENNDGGSRLSPEPKRNTSFEDLRKTLSKFSEANTNTTYAILDGLDKYGSEDLTNLFELIYMTINLSPMIHWIVSIRSFDNPTAIKRIGYTLANVSNSDKLKDAAKKFVSMEVDTSFQRTGIPDPSRKDFEKALMKRSKGNLLWITLACSIIEKDSMNAYYLAGKLEEKIEGLYVHVDKQLQLKAEENEYFGEIVAILAATYRPLTISELRFLIPLLDAVDVKEIIKRRFLLFLEVQDDIVCFSHELAKKYLIEKYVGQAGPEIHGRIALRCLESFASSSSSGNIFDEFPIHYVVLHWIKHFLTSQSTSGDLYTRGTGLGAIMVVLSRGFTRWLDVIKKTRYPVSEVNKDLLQLRDFLTVSYSPQSDQAVKHLFNNSQLPP